jgi:ankyrin repeat protein
VIGSPSGLPLKVASGAKVRDNLHPFYFNANLDTFQGNSGSAVFNAETGVVEGILVRGEEDFIPNHEKKCVEANRCDDDKCRGEDVTRMTAIPEVGVQKAFYEAAVSEDLKVIESILELNVWIDFYTKDGQSAFMKAVIAGREKSALLLLARGSELNLQDAKGNSVAHYLARKREAKSLIMMQSFLKRGLNLELTNNQGETALLSAAKALNLPRVKALIKMGAMKNAVDLNKESALFPFMRKGDNKAVKELIALGIDQRLTNLQGKTAFEVK